MPCGIFMVIPVVSTRGFCFQSGFLSRDRAGRSETGYIKLSTPGRTGGCMGRSSGDKDLVVDESGCCWRLCRNCFNPETICHSLFFGFHRIPSNTILRSTSKNYFKIVFACHIVLDIAPCIRRRSENSIHQLNKHDRHRTE